MCEKFHGNTDPYKRENQKYNELLCYKHVVIRSSHNITRFAFGPIDWFYYNNGIESMPHRQVPVKLINGSVKHTVNRPNTAELSNDMETTGQNMFVAFLIVCSVYISSNIIVYEELLKRKIQSSSVYD